ncbi:hypothetical protein FPV67DRAFT_1668127 [Lyophyllum atratum]|nr:hypothetical protein FPV67DRAFT_1668127 [Lyophyllum atratum]
MLRQTARRGRLEAFLHDNKSGSSAVRQLAEILEADNDGSSWSTRALSDAEIAKAHACATELDKDHYEWLLQYLNSIGKDYHSAYNQAGPHMLGTLILPPAARQSHQFKFDGRTYSLNNSHEGNSHIQFYIPGAADDAVETGTIEAIWELPLEGVWQVFFLVRPWEAISPAQLRQTPYAYEPCSNLQTKVVRMEQSRSAFIIEPRHIICHLAVYKNPERTYGLTGETLTICWGLNPQNITDAEYMHQQHPSPSPSPSPPSPSPAYGDGGDDGCVWRCGGVCVHGPSSAETWPGLVERGRVHVHVRARVQQPQQDPPARVPLPPIFQVAPLSPVSASHPVHPRFFSHAHVHVQAPVPHPPSLMLPPPPPPRLSHPGPSPPPAPPTTAIAPGTPGGAPIAKSSFASSDTIPSSTPPTSPTPPPPTPTPNTPPPPAPLPAPSASALPAPPSLSTSAPSSPSAFPSHSSSSPPQTPDLPATPPKYTPAPPASPSAPPATPWACSHARRCSRHTGTRGKAVSGLFVKGRWVERGHGLGGGGALAG